MSTHMTPWLYEQRALSGFIKLLVSGRHTDVDILCRGHTFNVHKTVLSAASTFFDRVCDSQFQEGQTSTITLDDDEPALVARMIIFAYSSTYHTDSLNSARPENAPFKTVPDPFAEEARADFIYDICKPRTKLHTMMYAMADKYDLTDLKSQARQRFLINFYDKDEYEGHCCQDQDLQDVVIPVPETWAEVTVITKLVYSTTPSSDRGLRDIVLEFMTRYFHVSNCPSAFEAKELMHLITNTHDLAADLATRSQTKLTYECTYCGSEQGHLTWCCECGKVDSCKEAACVEAAKKQSFCGDCCRLGTLEILENVARSI